MLEKLAEKHRMWISMLLKLGCHKDIAEDLVQEMYIKINNNVDSLGKILYNDEINRYFVWVVLRNLYISHIRNSKKVTIYPIIDTDGGIEEFSYENNEVLESTYFTYLTDKLNDIVDSFESRYDKVLYEQHILKGRKIAHIARESGVEKHSMYVRTKHIKRALKEALLEDLEDYYNKDYKIIKY